MGAMGADRLRRSITAVIPAKAGIHGRRGIEQQCPWIPAFAGMTMEG